MRLHRRIFSNPREQKHSILDVGALDLWYKVDDCRGIVAASVRVSVQPRPQKTLQAPSGLEHDEEPAGPLRDDCCSRSSPCQPTNFRGFMVAARAQCRARYPQRRSCIPNPMGTNRSGTTRTMRTLPCLVYMQSMCISVSPRPGNLTSTPSA